MADSFPDASTKLGVPAKKSLFERQKADAEAKKARERAETAAVYEDFVKSFDDEGSGAGSGQSGHRGGNTGGFGPGPGPGVGPGKRHFTAAGLKSGPGSLGPTPGPAKGNFESGPGRKRQYDDFSGHRGSDRSRGPFAFADERPDRRTKDTIPFSQEDDESRDVNEAKAAAKPTLHVSSLPPGTSPVVIKALFASSSLVIENVRILPPTPSDSGASERRSMSAILTLAAETPATEIDTTVSHLQNKYLGYGFNLSISRYLSSAALTTTTFSSSATSLQNLPFGARPVPQQASLSRAPPPGQGSGRFAPPASYTSATPYRSRAGQAPTQIHVQAPSDLRQLRLIHKTLEALLTYGPEFEALLMSRAHIQRDEQWSWLWNSRSTGGVYYRWRLWEVLTDARKRKSSARGGYGAAASSDILFEGQSVWISPEQRLKFEYTTKLEDIVSDDDYDSSDEEEDGDGGLARRHTDHNFSGAPPQDGVPDSNDGLGYLNPLAKTKLVHLLSRLPDASSKLRKGDVARITAFALEHAGAGADEVASLITRNVIAPSSLANRKASNDNQSDDNDNADQAKGKQDHTTTSLVGLYVISDILSSSASAGLRHAWRYRALFEAALRKQNVFAVLGRAEKDHAWGKLKADKWKRSVQNVLSLWEGWSTFQLPIHEEFTDLFLNPPLTPAEKLLADEEERSHKADEELRRSKFTSKWRSVAEEKAAADQSAPDDVAMEDVDGTAMADEDDMVIDGEDTDENLDGVPMPDSSDEEVEPLQEAAGEAEAEATPAPVKPETSVQQNLPVSEKKSRPRAVDMFADDSD